MRLRVVFGSCDFAFWLIFVVVVVIWSCFFYVGFCWVSGSLVANDLVVVACL